MTRTQQTLAGMILEADAVSYARSGNSWTARHLRLQRQGRLVEAWDAFHLAQSYRQRLRMVLSAARATTNEGMHA